MSVTEDDPPFTVPFDGKITPDDAPCDVTGDACVDDEFVVDGCVGGTNANPPAVDGCVVDGCVVDGCVVDGCVVDGCVVDGCVGGTNGNPPAVDGCVVDGCVVDEFVVDELVEEENKPDAVGNALFVGKIALVVAAGDAVVGVV